MNPVTRSRAFYGVLLLIHAVASFDAGAMIAALGREPAAAPLALLVIVLLGARSLTLAQFPAIVRNANWLLMRPLIFWELVGLVALTAGLGAAPGLVAGWMVLIVSQLTVASLAVVAARGGQEQLVRPARGFFLFTRGHFDDWSVRRHLLAHGVLAGLLAAQLTLILRAAPEPAAFSPQMRTFVVAACFALFLTVVQINPQRGIGFYHFGMMALVVAALGHAIVPQAVWPAAFLGIAAGLPLAGLSTAVLLQAHPQQRFAAKALATTCAGLAALLGTCVRYLPAERAAWSLAALSAALFAIMLRLYFREFAELVMEVVYWPLYRFRAYGPGLYEVPTRGPVLIIANHAAYFDPLFLGKVLPLRVRALMISTMFDKPFLKWLAGDVYGAIRVPDRPGFRRVMPELDQAIAVLKRGENIMIFPEAWLRRKEEQPLHRFAQGVYRILKELPETPVLPCWIEDSWGSYLSYKNGPPTKNKKFDWWYLIRMGLGKPEVLSPELLADNQATRRHLMERVLQARTYIGLPPHPMPGTTSVDVEEERDAGEPPADVNGARAADSPQSPRPLE